MLAQTVKNTGSHGPLGCEDLKNRVCRECSGPLTKWNFFRLYKIKKGYFFHILVFVPKLILCPFLTLSFHFRA